MTDDPAARWRHIEIVLDRSGSMHPIAAQTEAGLRGFLEAQAEVPGRTTVSLYQFDHVGELVFSNVELADVPDVRLQPRGATALFDALGDTIDRACDVVMALPKLERPDEIITVILTDGAENSSRRYDAPRLRTWIENRDGQPRQPQRFLRLHRRGQDHHPALTFWRAGGRPRDPSPSRCCAQLFGSSPKEESPVLGPHSSSGSQFRKESCPPCCLR